jgi:hypothetical protein
MARLLYQKTSKYTIDISMVNNNPPSEQILALSQSNCQEKTITVEGNYSFKVWNNNLGKIRDYGIP